jgi:L-alanine-DL-glutamate epimerase-like enolase superfamily enzyme
MCKVTLSARALSIPLKQPTRISTRVIGKRDYVIVTVQRDDSDKTGVGYIYAGTSGGPTVASFINDHLADVVRNQEADDIVGTWEAMFQETLLIGRRGVALRAMSAVDIALWDLAAKKVELPLAVMLGGSVRKIPAYASGGYYQPEVGDWNDAVRREIALNRSLGFTDHKIKVGGLSLREDAARVEAAIDAIDGQGRLALDANNAYKNVADACRAAETFERVAGEAGIWWFEEPLSTEDVRGLAQVRQRIKTPVATGEISQSRHEFRALIENYAADILQPDVGVLGGVTEYLRVLRTAESFGVSVAPHWHANVHVHLATVSTTCLAVEHFALEKDIYNFERIVTPESRLKTADGMLIMSDLPGIGVIFDEDEVNALEIGTESL